MSNNLEQIISTYGFSANKIRQDITQVTKQYQSLQPIADTFFYNNGNSMLLVCFTGTLPIKFNNTPYYIPIKLWLEKEYPRVCPNVYVTPTQGMAIKPKHKHVDSTGKCYFPYLNQWNQQTCHLLGLLIQMAQAFSEDPPVFSKPTQPQYPVKNIQPQYPLKNPPYPNNNPQYPPQYPPNNQFTNQYPPINNQYPLKNPQYPNNNPQYPPQYQNNPQYPPNNNIPQYPPNNNPQYPNNINNPQYPNNNPQYPNNNQYPLQQPQQIDPKIELISKLSTNLITELEKQAKSTIGEANEMNKVQLELTNRESSIENTLTSYNNEILSLNNSINFYQLRINNVDEWISKNNSNEEISVDSIVVPTSVLSNQLLNLVAENFAIDDTIHKLTDAFYQNVVDQDFFVKNMRDLTRDQFIKLSLIKKISQILGAKGINL
eukprot:TRINITY_DN107_c0_g1_i1.p1 TRINITY_DN107_c0_g1~~TRINITY_DN107_c0_g1_i1.p1  ORF type:complete len:431 (+),score=127.43 TRINITY_DN107_c0_g1_i1:33-1325(+)